MSKVSLILNSRLSSIKKAANLLLKDLREHKISNDAVFDIRIAFEEALVNAIKHGNKLNAKLKVFISWEVSSRRVAITISDEGKGFDYRRLPNPLAKGNINKPGGRGVFIIRRFMDKVSFLDCGRTVKMIKLIRK